jgi:hypothetical protein
MQIAVEVARVLTKKPNAIKMRHALINFTSTKANAGDNDATSTISKGKGKGKGKGKKLTSIYKDAERKRKSQLRKSKVIVKYLSPEEREANQRKFWGEDYDWVKKREAKEGLP